MKRLLLLFGLFFLLFFFLLGLFTLNINLFLNYPYFKAKLLNYLQRTYQTKVSYERVTVDLFKLHFKFQDFKLEHPFLILRLPKGKVDLGWSKVFSGSFFPDEIHLDFPVIKIFLPKIEEEDIEFDYRDFLRKLAPLRVRVKKGALEVNYEGRALSFKDVNLQLIDHRGQILFNFACSSPVFSQLHFKGWLNYTSPFGEGTIAIKGLNLRDVLKLAQIDTGDNRINFWAEVSLEKDKVLAGFWGEAPCLISLKGGEKVSCDYFEGQASYGRGGWEIDLPLIEFREPNFKGSLSVSEKEGTKDVVAKVQRLDFGQAKPLLEFLLPKEVFAELVTFVKAGTFKNLIVKGRGQSWEEVFNLSTLHLVGEVEGGQVTIPSSPLAFEGVKGEFELCDEQLFYSGIATTSEGIILTGSEVMVNFKGKEPILRAFTNFYGTASELKGLTLRLTDKYSSLAKYQLKGNLQGNLTVSGPLQNLDVQLSLIPKEVEVFIEGLNEPFKVEGGKIVYEKGGISFQGLNLFFQSSKALALQGSFDLTGENLKVHLPNLVMDGEDIFTLASLDPDLKKTLQRYSLDLKEVSLNDVELKLRDFINLSKEQIWERIRDEVSFKAKLKNLGLKLKKIDLPFQLFSPEVSFLYDKGFLTLEDSLVFVDDSAFTFRGNLILKERALYLKGLGEVKTLLYEKVSQLASLPSSLKLKLPLKFNLRELELSPEGMRASLDIFGQTSTLNFSLKQNPKIKDLHLSGRLSGKASELNLQLILTDEIRGQLKGLLRVDEVAEFLAELPVAKGEIASDLSFTIPKMDLVRLGQGEDPVERLVDLLSQERFIPEPSFIEGKDLALLKPVNFTTSFLALIKGNKVSFPKLQIKKDDLSLNGDLNLTVGKGFLGVNGTLSGPSINLKELWEKNRGKLLGKSKDFSFVITANLGFSFEQLILPSNHTIEKVKGYFNFTENKIFTLSVPNLQFCGLSFYVVGEKNPDHHYVFIELNPSSGDLLDLFSCLYPSEMPRIIFEGPFTAKGFFYFDGEKALMENSYGKVEVFSRRGYLYRAPLLMKVLVFLSPIDLFRGKIPNLERDLLEYEEVNLKSSISNHRLHVDTFFMSAPGFRMFSHGTVNLYSKELSLTFLVSPFKTVDLIIERLPYLNKLLLGEERMLIYLPLEVVGTYESPTIVPLHPLSLGKGIFRFIFKFFGIQEEFFQKKPDLEGFKRRDVLQRKLENPQGR